MRECLARMALPIWPSSFLEQSSIVDAPRRIDTKSKLLYVPRRAASVIRLFKYYTEHCCLTNS